MNIKPPHRLKALAPFESMCVCVSYQSNQLALGEVIGRRCEPLFELHIHHRKLLAHFFHTTKHLVLNL